MVQMKRAELRKSRILAMKTLYNLELVGEGNLDLMEIEEETLSEFCVRLIDGVKERKIEIDSIISNNLQNYTIDRISYVDLAIVRVATFELLSKTPANIVINEALEIVKEYSDSGDGKNKRFMHRLIDNINKSLC